MSDRFFNQSLTRIKRLQKAHDFLCAKSQTYSKWHQHPAHQKVHLISFFTILVGTIVFTGLIVFQGLKNPVKAAAISYTVTAKEEWEAGTNTNIDTEDTNGDLKLAANGTWGVRNWSLPPNTLTLGTAFTTDGTDIYVLRGGGDSQFYKYSPATNSWATLTHTPMGVYGGAFLEMGPADTIYAIFGYGTKSFYRYTISTDTWTQLEDASDTFSTGSSMAYANGLLYVIRSQNTAEFWIYNPNPSEGQEPWSSGSTNGLATVNNASSLVYDGSKYLYLLRGNNTTTWYRYDVTSDAPAWETMTTNYPVNINEWTIMEYYGGAVYVQHPNSTTFYRCTISGLTCSGNAWETLETLPATARYGGVIVFGDYLYNFRASSTMDFWKFDPSTGHFVGPPAFPQAITTGGDLLWDGDEHGYVYGLKGGVAANGFYRYDIDNNSWSSVLNITNLPALNYDTKAVIAPDNNLPARPSIYLFQGNSTNVFRYDTTTNENWTSIAGIPASTGNGGGMAYNANISSDLIFGIRGAGQTSFYAYSISNNNWTTFDPTDLPAGVGVNIGGRIVATDSRIYVLTGNGSTRFFEYNYNGGAGGGTWTEKTRAPFPAYYGTDMTVYNNKIYATAGNNYNTIYEYDPSNDTWRKLPNFHSQSTYALGANNGASIEYYGGASMMVSRGAVYSGGSTINQEILTFTASADKYQGSGTYISPIIDLTYAEGWSTPSFSISADADNGSSVTFSTKTSADGSTWPDSWTPVANGTTIGSDPDKRYIQVKAFLQSSEDHSTTPVVHSYQIFYETDVTKPSNPNPANIIAKSQEVGGIDISSGSTYNFAHPYFTWPAVGEAGGASDTGSGVLGYYVYYGPNSGANPVTDGQYQSSTSYIVNENQTTGNNYLIVQTKDRAGMVADATILFTYVYNGVAPVQSVTKTTTGDFTAGTISNLNPADNQLKLTGKDGFWQQYRLTGLPANVGNGAAIVYKPSIGDQGTLYVARGAGTTAFYSYDIATDTWTIRSSANLTNINIGGGIVNGPGNYIYAAAGNNSNKFFRYDVTNDAAGWDDAAAEDGPVGSFAAGGCFVYDGARYIYAAIGSNDNFFRYDPLTTSDGEWSQKANFNFGYPDRTPNNNTANGSAFAYDGSNTIYAIQGGLYSGGFAKYTISSTGANTWTPITTPLPAAPGGGASLAWDSTTSMLYYTPGNNLRNMYKFNPGTNQWTEVAAAPLYLGIGSYIKPIGDYFYVLRGNSTAFYKYSVSKNSWFVPTNNIFGPSWFDSPQSTSTYWGVYYGSDMVKGDGANLYAMRGNYDNQFVKYNSLTGTVTHLANVPSGTYAGGGLCYDSTDNAIYAMSSVEPKWFKYDIATNVWTQMPTDMPAIPGSGGSMTYDGSRYLYYVRGANTTQWYRYDKNSSAWSAALSTTNLTTIYYGAELMYNDGYIYTLRGNNVNPNPFYRFNVAALPEVNPQGNGAWEVLPSLGAAVYNDGFLVKGEDGYLYAAPAGNSTVYGNNWWRYNIASPGWEQLANFPGQAYVGATGARNGANKIFAFSGPGTDSFPEGLYSYIQQSADSSFVDSGSYTSQVLDLTSVYNWANITLSYNETANTTVTIETQSSSDNITWSSWAPATQEKVIDAATDVHQYAINSAVNRYLKVKITLASGDGFLSPTISDFTVNYYQDTTPPSNPSSLTAAKSQASGGTDIIDDHWGKFAQPYFAWDAPSDNAGGSGVAGYYLYFGEANESGECQGNPQTTPGSLIPNEGSLYYQTATSFTVPANILIDVNSGKTYCFRLTTKDNAGNIQSEPFQAFKYKFDNQKPSDFNDLTVNPDDYTR